MHQQLTVDFRNYISRIGLKKWLHLSSEEEAKTRILQNLNNLCGQGRLSEAINLITEASIQVDYRPYTLILKFCSNAKHLREGKRIHAYVISTGFGKDMLGNHLIEMYHKCRSVLDAEQVFVTLFRPNEVSWNRMVAAYAQNYQMHKAIIILQQMHLQQVRVNKVTFLTILNECSDASFIAEGKLVHAHIACTPFELDQIVGTALVNMYGKCGMPEEARKMFDKLDQTDIFLWNTMVGVYTKHEQGKEALQLFRELQYMGLKPDNISFISILHVPSSSADMGAGKFIHAYVIDSKIESDAILENALVYMYGKCGNLDAARRIFDMMFEQNVASCNAMIAGYAQHGHILKAFQIYQEMDHKVIHPDKITFLSLISACTSPENLEHARLIHAQIVANGLISDLIVGNALLSMFGKCGALDDACVIFDGMKRKDVISWNAMIAAYVQQGKCKKGLKLFQQIAPAGLEPSLVTFITVLDVCADMAALGDGKLIHALVVEVGLESNIMLCNSLVNMYSNCGKLEYAQQIFDKMPYHDIVSWNIMIAAYAQHGHAKKALSLFQRMRREGVGPDGITFISLLSACSHAGLLVEGQRCFESMSVEHSVQPKIEHYGCMVDLLGRAGCLGEAEDLITRMPFQPDVKVWMTMLSACQVHGDVIRGKSAAEHVLNLDPENAAAYVVLSNIYALKGQWDEVKKLRSIMASRGVRKEPGQSSLEIDGKVHVFLSRDRSHPQTEEIYAELGRLQQAIKNEGYIPETNLAFHDVEQELKETLLSSHSERLALAFGLISTSSEMPLCIIKNLRVCADCHTAIKFISKIAHREISVRDCNRFHHFRNGVCSCADYW